MPSSSAIACSGSSAATSVTKSPVPSASAVCTIRSARAASASRRRPIARGVKPRETIPRSLVCSGGGRGGGGERGKVGGRRGTGRGGGGGGGVFFPAVRVGGAGGARPLAR